MTQSQPRGQSHCCGLVGDFVQSKHTRTMLEIRQSLEGQEATSGPGTWLWLGWSPRVQPSAWNPPKVSPDDIKLAKSNEKHSPRPFSPVTGGSHTRSFLVLKRSKRMGAAQGRWRSSRPRNRMQCICEQSTTTVTSNQGDRLPRMGNEGNSYRRRAESTSTPSWTCLFSGVQALCDCGIHWRRVLANIHLSARVRLLFDDVWDSWSRKLGAI